MIYFHFLFPGDSDKLGRQRSGTTGCHSTIQLMIITNRLGSSDLIRSSEHWWTRVEPGACLWGVVQWESTSLDPSSHVPAVGRVGWSCSCFFFLTLLGSTLPPIMEVEHGYFQDVLDKRFIFVHFPQNLLLHFSMPVWKPMSWGSSIPARLARSKGGRCWSVFNRWVVWELKNVFAERVWPVTSCLGIPETFDDLQIRRSQQWCLPNPTQMEPLTLSWSQRLSSHFYLDTTTVDHPFSVRSLVSADVTNPNQWTSKTRFSGKGWLFIEKPEFQDLCCWPQKTRVHWDWGQNGLATWTMEFHLSQAAK